MKKYVLCSLCGTEMETTNVFEKGQVCKECLRDNDVD